MKRSILLLCALLALMCILPAASLAENLVMGDIDGEVINLGAFSLTIGRGDICEVKTEERIVGEPWKFFYPSYDYEATLHSNMNVIWTDKGVLTDIPDDTDGLQLFAQSTAEGTVTEAGKLGIPCTIVSATAKDNIIINGIEFRAIEHVLDWDYTQYTQGRVGTVRTTNLQLFTNLADGGYIITLTTYTDEDVELLMNLLSTIAPNN